MKKFFTTILFFLVATLVFAVTQVNLNSATAADIAKIKGIGHKKAEAIVKYRKEHGNFKKIEDLSKVKGIGPKLLEKIKKYATVQSKKVDQNSKGSKGSKVKR